MHSAWNPAYHGLLLLPPVLCSSDRGVPAVAAEPTSSTTPLQASWVDKDPPLLPLGLPSIPIHSPSLAIARSAPPLLQIRGPSAVAAALRRCHGHRRPRACWPCPRASPRSATSPGATRWRCGAPLPPFAFVHISGRRRSSSAPTTSLQLLNHHGPSCEPLGEPLFLPHLSGRPRTRASYFPHARPNAAPRSSSPAALR